jgi:hypothetical protein
LRGVSRERRGSGGEGEVFVTFCVYFYSSSRFKVHSSLAKQPFTHFVPYVPFRAAPLTAHIP